jgi:translation initiation factor IF-2
MSDKVKVSEIAEESGTTSTEVIKKAKDLGIELKANNSTVSYEDAEDIMNYIMTGKSKKLQKKATKPKEVKAKKKEPAKKEPVKQEKKTTQKEVKKAEPIKKQKKKLADTTTIRKVTSKAQEKEKIESKEITKEEKLPTIDKKIVKKTSQEIKPKKEKPKEENEQTTTNKDTTPSKEVKTVMARRTGGIRFVKKKRPKLEISAQEQPKKPLKSMSELFGNTPEVKNDYKPKIKKEKKKVAPKAQNHGKVLDVVTDSEDFSNSTDSILGEEVILLDMDLQETSKFLQDQPKQKEIRTTKPSAFGNQPRGLSRNKRKKRVKKEIKKEEITSVVIPQEIRVYEFAEKIGTNTSDVISKLFMLGMMVTKNDFLGNDEIEILGDEYNIEITIKDELEEVNYEEVQEENEDNTNLIERPPVVTIMGHVDHGKTSLLDKIRNSRIANSEAGGITQHIGAYTIQKDNKKITFVDTPGHAAFFAMRARGASVTDVIIIVVAADDGVKPQTIEAISHAKASNAPIIVAINKIDKEGANIDMVKAGMAEHDLTPVDWGGDTEFIPVSALNGEGIEELLENILIQAELLELKANPTINAKCVVIESSLAKGRGPVATVIVQNGTLKVGDNIVADTTFGRVKAITNDQGKSVKELNLSETGQILGLGEVPTTGVILASMNSEKEAKEIAITRAEHARAKELSKSTKVSLDELSNLIAEGKIKNLPVIIKADAGGSLEAIKGALEKIKNEEVQVKILHGGVGGITESDLVLANSSENCIILGFNVRPTGAVKSKAKADGITINTYTVIYDLIDDIKEALSGMMSKKVREENTGQAEVRDTFVVPKIGTVAGCMVTDGKVIKGGNARIIRDGIIVYTGKISSLKRFKDDVKEVSKGYECGIMFEGHNDIKKGDFIETFIEIEEDVKIDDV